MDVPRGRLGVSGNGTVDIVDVKCGPIVSGSLRRGQGLSLIHISRGNGGGRQMYDAVCAECGRACKVPFEPRGDRPVYCSDCFRR